MYFLVIKFQKMIFWPYIPTGCWHISTFMCKDETTDQNMTITQTFTSFVVDVDMNVTSQI